jgi:hypothetical protein
VYSARSQVCVNLLVPLAFGIFVSYRTCAQSNGPPNSVAPRLQSQTVAADSANVYAKTAAQLESAARAAREMGDRKTEAHLALDAARAYELGAAAGDASQQSHAEAAYREAIAATSNNANGELRARAVNNLAVLLLDEGKKHDALNALSNLRLQGLGQEQRAVYLFNSGKVLEANEDWTAAYQDYVSAYATNGNLGIAAEAAFRLLQREGTPKVDQAVSLARSVSSRGCSENTRRAIHQLIEQWGQDSQAVDLLAALVGCYVAGKVDLSGPDAGELPLLRRIAATYPNLRPAISQIELAYSGNLQSDPQSAREAFPNWLNRDWESSAFAAFLKVIGDSAAEAGNDRVALARYAAAWSLANDPVYALEFASLLSRDPGLDPDGRLLDDLLSSMFSQKGSYYAVEDWPNILRMHVAIGTILEERGIWGTSDSPRSAIFQWEHAVLAQEQVRLQTPDSPPLAGLHMHLGDCYTKAKMPGKAAEEFVAAAEAYLEDGKEKETLEASNLAHQIGDAVTSESAQARLANVDRALTKDNCPNCVQTAQLSASDSWTVGPGDYILNSGVPVCGEHVNELLAEAAQALTTHRMGGAYGSLSSVLTPATQGLQPPLAGLVGRLPNQGPEANCVPLAVVIPATARVIAIQLQAGDETGTRDCTPGQDCQIGWSRFDPPQFLVAGDSILVTSVFRNWSGDRSRNATMTVQFVPK